MRALTGSDGDGGRASSAPRRGGEALQKKSIKCKTALTTGVIALELSACQRVRAEKIKYGSGKAIKCHHKSLQDELYWPVRCANADMLLNRRGLPRDCREKRWASRVMGESKRRREPVFLRLIWLRLERLLSTVATSTGRRWKH